MILFNTTFAVDSNIADDFIEFIRDTYIPLAEGSDLYGFLLTEMHGEASTNSLTGENVRTFALQMRSPSRKIMDEFRQSILPNIYQYITNWGMGVSMFESQLDVVYDHSKKDGRKG